MALASRLPVCEAGSAEVVRDHHVYLRPVGQRDRDHEPPFGGLDTNTANPSGRRSTCRPGHRSLERPLMERALTLEVSIPGG